MFGKNIKGRYDEELIKKGANCRFSNAATGIGAMTMHLRLVTYANASKYVVIWGLEGRFVAVY